MDWLFYICGGFVWMSLMAELVKTRNLPNNESKWVEVCMTFGVWIWICWKFI